MNIFWTPDKLAELVRLRKSNVGYQHIANSLGTSESSAKSAYKRHIVGRPDEVGGDNRDRTEYFRQWEESRKDERNAAKRERRKRNAASL